MVERDEAGTRCHAQTTAPFHTAARTPLAKSRWISGIALAACFVKVTVTAVEISPCRQASRIQSGIREKALLSAGEEHGDVTDEGHRSRSTPSAATFYADLPRATVDDASGSSGGSTTVMARGASAERSWGQVSRRKKSCRSRRSARKAVATTADAAATAMSPSTA